jgi:hypothetical protein
LLAQHQDDLAVDAYLGACDLDASGAGAADRSCHVAELEQGGPSAEAAVAVDICSNAGWRWNMTGSLLKAPGFADGYLLGLLPISIS